MRTRTPIPPDSFEYWAAHKFYEAERRRQKKRLRRIGAWLLFVGVVFAVLVATLSR